MHTARKNTLSLVAAFLTVKFAADNSAAKKKRKLANSDKENKPAKGPKRTSPRAGAAAKAPEEASPMVQSAVKSSAKGKSGAVKSDSQGGSGDTSKRDALIGRCIKKDFETDSRVKAFTGWIIGLHNNKKWYGCIASPCCVVRYVTYTRMLHTQWQCGL